MSGQRSGPFFLVKSTLMPLGPMISVVIFAVSAKNAKLSGESRIVACCRLNGCTFIALGADAALVTAFAGSVAMTRQK